MEISVCDETYSFLFSVLLGFLTGIIFEFFTIIKKRSEKKSFKNFTDALFVVFSFSFCFYMLYLLNGISIRFYHIVGIIIGIFLYFNTINRFVNKFLSYFFVFFEKILKILLLPASFLCKIIYRVLLYFKAFFKWFLKIIIKPFKKPLKELKQIFKRRKIF